MKIKLLKPYGMLAAGAEMDTRTGVAELLIQRRVAVAVEARPESGAIASVMRQFNRPRKGERRDA